VSETTVRANASAEGSGSADLVRRLTELNQIGIALSRAVRVARRPAAVGVHGMVGHDGVVRRDGMVQINGELWRAHTEDNSPLVPGEHVRVERVEEGLRLVVGSPVSPNEEEAR